MSWKNPPPRPTGIGTSATFFKWVWDMLMYRLKPIDTDTVTWDKDYRGLRANVNIPPSAPAAPASVQSIGTLLAVYDNYIVLQDIVSGAIIRAAKMYHLRNNIVSETTLDGTIWNFTYTGASLKYQARSKIPAPNPGGVPPEYQRVTKVYCLAGGTTPADQISYSQMSAAVAAAVNIKTIAADNANIAPAVGTLVTYLETGPWRLWAKKIDQSTP